MNTMNTMNTAYITTSPTDTRIVYYRLGTDPGTMLLKTVNDKHEALIAQSWDTQVFGSRPFIYGVTTDEELSAWFCSVSERPLNIAICHDRDLYFELDGKRGYIAVSRHDTIAYANWVGVGMYNLFEIDRTQRREVEDSGISLEEFLIATISAYGGVVVK